MSDKKSRLIYVIVAIVFGDFGMHQFYLKNYKKGILYLILSWTYIPFLFALYDIIKINDNFEEYEKKHPYDKDMESYVVESELLDNEERRRFQLESQVSNNSKFYNEEEIILDKYRNLVTPQSILNSLYQVVNDNRLAGTSNFIVESKETKFLKDSVRYRYTREDKCSFKPFMCYWTTFDDLDKEQKSWYFYWRECVLNGNYIDTDLSYIFLFIYELLNYSFNQKAAFNISMIERLNDAYSERYSELSKYLKPWMTDFLCELGVKSKKQDAYFIENKMYKTLKNSGDSIDKISINSWKIYIYYNKTKFFSPNKDRIYRAFKKNMKYLNDFYKEKGSSLIDEWFAAKKSTQYFSLFNLAVIGRKREGLSVEYIRHEPNARMYSEVTQIFRMTVDMVKREMNENIKVNVEYNQVPEGFIEFLESKLRDEDMKEEREGLTRVY